MQNSDRDRIPCYFDGACPGNQFEDKGPMRAAYVIGNREFVRHVPDLVTATGPLRSNNIAEYHGLIFLLRHLLEMEAIDRRGEAYAVFGDSQLVIRQMTGHYRVRQAHLKPLNAEARRLAAELDVTFEEVPRLRNKAGFLLETRSKGLSPPDQREATREN